jgi:hypothetical protein
MTKQPHVVYIADTGEPRHRQPATGRLGARAAPGPIPERAIFKMVLNADPTVVDSLSILIDGDVGGYAIRCPAQSG